MPTSTTQAATPDDRAWTTKKGIARRYEVSARCIDNWVVQRRIPSAKVGKTIRFHIPSCDAALKRFERKEVA